jgi:rod shape-determining protein MreD
MTATPWRQMTGAERARWVWDHWKLGLPMIAVIMATMVMTVPIFTPLTVMPNLALLLVLLWTLYRPQQMPDWTGFIAGLAGDVFLGTPIGANALLMPLFMLLVAVADRQVRRVSWREDWLFSVPLVLVYHVALWRLCAFAGPPIPFLPLATQAAATVAIYPLAAHLFARAQRRWAP